MRQKALLQALQDALLDEDWELVERGIMVLLVKQVHLQNDGGAGGLSARNALSIR